MELNIELLLAIAAAAIGGGSFGVMIKALVDRRKTVAEAQEIEMRMMRDLLDTARKEMHQRGLTHEQALQRCRDETIALTIEGDKCRDDLKWARGQMRKAKLDTKPLRYPKKDDKKDD